MSSKSPTKDSGPPGNGISRPCPPSLAPSEAKSTATPNKTSLASVIKSSSAKVSPDKVTKTPCKTPSKTPFRHSWMKKVNSKGQPFTAVKVEEDYADEQMANSSEESKRKVKIDTTPVTFIASGNGYKPNAVSGPADEGNREHGPVTPHKQVDDDDTSDEDPDTNGGRPMAFMDENGVVGPYHPSVKQSLNNMDKARRKLKSETKDPNGRWVGRSLVLWHRDRMMEKLLLNIQYECHKAGLRIPWDAVVHRLNPGSSGPSAVQMLNKLRDVLVCEGHMIPPVLGKATQAEDATLRGYARDMDAEIPTTTRAIRWNEAYPNRKKSLVVPGLIRGSGKYRTVPKDQLVPVPKDVGRRVRIPKEVVEQQAAQRSARDSAKKLRSAARSTRVKKEKQSDSEEEIDPAELDSDEEYKPSNSKQNSGGRKPRTNPFDDEDPFSSPTPKTSSTKGRKNALTKVGIDGLPTLTLHFALPSDILSQFPAGVSGMGNRRDIEDDAKLSRNLFRNHRSSLGSNASRRMSVDQNMRGTLMADVPTFMCSGKDLGEEYVYQGEAIHGSLDAFNKAIMEGADPLANGTDYYPRLFNQIAKDPNLVHTLALSVKDFQALSDYAESIAPSQKSHSLDQNGARTNMEIDVIDSQVQASFATAPSGGNADDIGSQVGRLNSQPYTSGMQQFDGLHQHFSDSPNLHIGYSSMDLYSSGQGFIDQGQHGLPVSTPFLHAEGAIYEDEHGHHGGKHYVSDWVDGGNSPAQMAHFGGGYHNDENSGHIGMDESSFHDAVVYEEPEDIEDEDAPGFHQY